MRRKTVQLPDCRLPVQVNSEVGEYCWRYAMRPSAIRGTWKAGSGSCSRATRHPEEPPACAGGSCSCSRVQLTG